MSESKAKIRKANGKKLIVPDQTDMGKSNCFTFKEITRLFLVFYAEMAEKTESWEVLDSE